MYVADATSTLRIGSCVFDNNYRHPRCWPKKWPRLIGSRAGALSWAWEPERSELITTSQACRSIAPSVRVQRLAESVSIFKQFFTQDSVTFAGEHYRVTDLPAIPKAAQRPHPPIFIGGGGKSCLRWRRARPTLSAWNAS